MKVSTIEEIHRVLKNHEETACSAYRELKEKLQEKYDTIRLNSVVTEEEAKKLGKRREAMYKASDLLGEFEQNEW